MQIINLQVVEPKLGENKHDLQIRTDVNKTITNKKTKKEPVDVVR
jgi:hypothetical protein